MSVYPSDTDAMAIMTAWIDPMSTAAVSFIIKPNQSYNQSINRFLFILSIVSKLYFILFYLVFILFCAIIFFLFVVKQVGDTLKYQHKESLTDLCYSLQVTQNAGRICAQLGHR